LAQARGARRRAKRLLENRTIIDAAHNLPLGAHIFIGHDARIKPKCGNSSFGSLVEA